VSAKRRQLVLNVFFKRFGHHPATWRHPSSTGTGRPDIDWWIRAARLAEEAKFDAFFIADFVGRSGEVTAAMWSAGISYQFEPLTLLSIIAGATRNIGLVATVNTNYEHPYGVARKLTSLDHLSRGRAGWNIVSSLNDHSIRNFGIRETLGHDERYARAGEFVELSKALWNTWDDDAFDHPDRQAGKFFDPRSAHPLEFEGRYFASDGLLDFPRPVQGYPVLVQAGRRASRISPGWSCPNYSGAACFAPNTPAAASARISVSTARATPTTSAIRALHERHP
jgi:FMN-dependent oxidoreductase (nitrilotriacetate monooxygenase family)